LLHADETRTRVPETEWQDLVRSIAAGDQHALHALYERTHRIVYTLSVRITGNRETAEEVTLDVFHGVWRSASSYDPAGGPVVGWLVNQARSRAIDRLRFERRKKRTKDPASAAPLAMEEREPHENLQARDRARLLREALTLLSAVERQAIETAFFSGLTYEQTALRLNRPVGTIKTRIRSGLEKLHEVLQRRVDQP